MTELPHRWRELFRRDLSACGFSNPSTSRVPNNNGVAACFRLTNIPRAIIAGVRPPFRSWVPTGVCMVSLSLAAKSVKPLMIKPIRVRT